MVASPVVKVLFFARIRDELGVPEMDLTLSERTNDVSSLLGQLKAQGEPYRSVLSAPDLLVAVNQALAESQTLIQPGDEVALYPPVTGG